MRKMHWRKFLCEIFSLLLVFTLASSVCFAYNPVRTGLNTVLSIDNFVAFGLGYGFNINEHLNINMDLFFTKTDYSAANFWAPFFIEDDVTIQGYDLNLDINLLKSQISPLMTGGIGYINFSGNSGFAEFDETDFSYNLGVGIRDTTDHFFFKVLYKATWTKLEDSDSNIKFDGLNLAMGYIF